MASRSFVSQNYHRICTHLVSRSQSYRLLESMHPVLAVTSMMPMSTDPLERRSHSTIEMHHLLSIVETISSSMQPLQEPKKVAGRFSSEPREVRGQPNWQPCPFQRRNVGVVPFRQHVGTFLNQGVISISANSSLVEKGGLPPSKSHLIRWLLLASQGQGQVEIQGVSGAAKDACAMRDALIGMGVHISIKENSWTVQGVGSNGFKPPMAELNLHNSGTSLRLLSIAATRIGEWITIDGDSTLDARIDRDFWRSLGIDVAFDCDERNFPMKIKGPLNKSELSLNCEKTSQHLSAIVLSMPAMKNPLQLTIERGIVSRRHAQLSFELAAKCGSPNTIGDPLLQPWDCKPPSHVQIPLDASHIAFWKLYEMIHGTTIQLPKVESDDSIGAEILIGLNLEQYQTVDLREANDLITPLAAAMAIGGGGVICGANHARHKESNRIDRTVEMLAYFSIDIERTPDGLRIVGGQCPTHPASLVPTFGDHRMQMTAVVLATKVGADIEGAELHEVSFPEFIKLIIHDDQSDHRDD